MLKLSKINVKKTKWNKEFCNSRLELNLSGSNITHTILNTIRRVTMSNIPIFAFDKIDIHNTSTFKNNYMKNKIENISVLGIDNNINFYTPEEEDSDAEEEEFDQENGLIDDIQLNVDEKLNYSSLNQLTMYLNYKNTNSDVTTVTTKNSKFYYMEKEIPNPYKNEVQIIKLNPGEEIKLSAITNIGIENQNAKYSAVSVIFYKENSKDNYDLILESSGQLNEKRILEVCIMNIIRILDELIKNVPDNNKKKGKLVIPNSDHTLGNLLSDGLRSHKSVKFSGYAMPHPLGNEIIVNYELEKGDIKSILGDVIEYYKILFNNIQKSINKL